MAALPTAFAEPSPLAPSIKSLPDGERPRERLLLSGRDALSDVELVALVLGGKLAVATAVVASCGGLRGLGRAVVGELRLLHGLGPARAAQLVAACELGRRVTLLAGRPDDSGTIRGSLEAAAIVGDLALREQEELQVLALDSRHRLLVRFVAARGSLNVVHVSPRDVFRRLVREGAAAAIVAHNHPSGDPLPSLEDVELTQRLREAGELIGVPLLDHLVIGGPTYYSFTDGRRGDLPLLAGGLSG